MHVRLTALVAPLAVLACLACTTSKGITPDEPRPAPVPPPGAQEAWGPSNAPLQELSIGAACKVEDTVHCGTKGRVSVIIEMRNTPQKVPAFPCEMQRLAREGSADQSTGCVQDDRVYLTGECVECRQYSRWHLTGLVAEMTDAQLLNTQQRIGLPPKPVLHTPEAWRGALAWAAAKPPRSRN